MFAKIAVLAVMFAFGTVAEAYPEHALTTTDSAQCITCWPVLGG